MSRKNNRTYSTSAVAVGVAIVALVTFVAFFAHQSCGNAGSNSNSNASASPSPRAQTTGSASAGQPTPGASQPAATPQSEESVTTPAITGTVKREGTGELVTDAVVVLYSGDKRRANPRTVDEESGKFRFEEITLKAGISYSLQTKAPGLCGEDTFNLASVDAHQTIYRDIILKPCQSSVVVPTPSPAKVDDPGLLQISGAVGGIVGPLNTVKVWIQILATTWILTMILLLIATLAYLIPLRSQVAESRKQIDLLLRRGETVTPKPNEGPRSTNMLSMPAEVSQALAKVLVVLERIASRKAEPPGNDYDDWERREEQPQRAATNTTPVYPQSHVYSSLPDPDQWYGDLFQGKAVNPAPLYVEINNDSSENDPLYKRRICFDERTHGSFVVFSATDDTGLIFPRPNSTLVADHRRVFGHLDQENVEQQKPKKDVIFQEGCWQLSL